MKKSYITPTSQEIALQLESMVAMSIAIDNDKEVGGSDAYTNKGGWSSENWTDTESTDEF